MPVEFTAVTRSRVSPPVDGLKLKTVVFRLRSFAVTTRLSRLSSAEIRGEIPPVAAGEPTVVSVVAEPEPLICKTPRPDPVVR